MASGDAKTEKELKQLKNNELKEPNNKSTKGLIKKKFKPTEGSDNEEESSASFERIRALFQKTEEMKEMAKEKNREVENQFESLRERLNSSSMFLNQMKSSIENLRFSYQKKLMEQHTEDYEEYFNNKEKFKGKAEIDNYLEELRGKIETLQMKPKEFVSEDKEPQDYQSAIRDVVENLKIIDQGLYSSTRNFGNQKN